MKSTILNCYVDKVKEKCAEKGIHIGILWRRKYYTNVSFPDEDALTVLQILANERRRLFR